AGVSHFSLGALFEVKQAHLDDGLLEVKEEHGLVEGIGADRASRPGGRVQRLVGGEHTILPDQRIVVDIVKVIPSGVERLLGIISCAARFQQRLREVGIQIWIRRAQTALER
ncbi:hypothetical protein PanWU01x14_046170, partial [Parasponia andersonii]